MTYSIISDGYRGQKCVLVDRKITKLCWWTATDETIIARFSSKASAEVYLQRLRYNNPRIIKTENALKVLSEQSNACIKELKEQNNTSTFTWATKY